MKGLIKGKKPPELFSKKSCLEGKKKKGIKITLKKE